LAILFVVLGRLLVRAIQRFLLSKNIGVHRLALIGDESSVATVNEELSRKPSLGFRVVRTYAHLDSAAADELKKLRRQGGLDEIILDNPNATHKEALQILRFAEQNHLVFKYSADVFEAASARTEIHTYGGTPIIEIKRTPLDGWGAIYKRLFDIVGSLILIVLTSPIMLITAIAILVESGRPIFFKNERVGERGQHFQTIKFRSMYQKFSIGSQKGLGDQAAARKLEAELISKQSKQGPVYKITADPRITKIGKFIRKYSLDELPQFFNVLSGKMSLIGPRPHQPREVQNYKPEQIKVMAIKPGISGMAQISGRSDLQFDEEARLDTYYIENWTPLLDLYILLKTPFVVIFNRGAY